MPLPLPPSDHVIHRLFEPIGALREQNLLMMHPSGPNYWTRTSGFLTVGRNARSCASTFVLKERLDTNCAPSDFLLFLPRTVCHNKAKPGSRRRSEEVLRHAESLATHDTANLGRNKQLPWRPGTAARRNSEDTTMSLLPGPPFRNNNENFKSLFR